ncbi:MULTISPECIES: hypothetical protein [unclassified Stenotrophomonas]|uniref:hypothetical protein n=1 Tax=unclassified Stenotrophomonas TaxID=196198 RepID=UPI0018D3F34D|nr:hypothetical protein [Stenotrophomonas maltophilia]MCI1051607.1 hypothetical protein [Stenotrophomonas maltophilia]
MDDYESAAVRHFKDAEALRMAGRKDNAGHLIGFSAECAIKHKIKTLRTDASAPHGHFPELLMIARKHLQGRSLSASMHSLLKNDVLVGWSVNRRYYVTGSTSDAELQDWFVIASRLMATAGIKR